MDPRLVHAHSGPKPASVGTAPPQVAKAAPRPPQSAGRVLLQLLAALHSRQSAEDAATALATELATTFLCDRVSIGIQTGKCIRLMALSHQPLAKEKQPLLQLIVAAMEEAGFQRTTIRFPLPDGTNQPIVLAHTELSNRLGTEAIASVPLAHERNVYGVITFERPSSNPFTTDEVAFFEHTAVLLGPIIELKEVVGQPWWRMVWGRMRKQWALWAAHSRTMKIGIAGMILFLAMLSLLPIEYRVGAPARLEGSIQRAMAAPMDGYIKQVHVRAGDEVKTEQVMVELSDEEFRLEQHRRESELTRLQNSLGDALAKHDNSQIGVLSAKAQEAKAHLDLATAQLQRATIRAPFDGVVIKGDLSQHIGSPVRQGDTLFIVSPSHGQRVLLEIDERDIADLSLGQRGVLTLTAYPSQDMPFTVKRITPLAVTKDARNYFEVEATLQDASPLLRPGLQGAAKISVGQRTALWVVGHDGWNWLRLTTWSWFG